MRSAICALFLIFATPAFSQNVPCAPRAEVVKDLQHDKFSVVGQGLTENGQIVVEVWASEGGDNWVMIATNTKNKSCMLDRGVGWMAVRPRAHGEQSS